MPGTWAIAALPLGAVTEPVLQAMGFRTYVLRRRDEIDEILQGAQILADDAKKAGGGVVD